MDRYRTDTMDERPTKRSRKNPIGQDVFLNADGTLVFDETKIRLVQRLWKMHAYAPGGIMYSKIYKDWERLVN